MSRKIHVWFGKALWKLWNKWKDNPLSLSDLLDNRKQRILNAIRNSEELIVFFGIITSHKYFLMPKILITFAMAIGMILTPIYSLSMSRQMFYGYKLFNVPNSYFFDSGPRELLLSISLFLPILDIGMYPDFVLSLSVDKVEVILSNSFSK